MRDPLLNENEHWSITNLWRHKRPSKADIESFEAHVKAQKKKTLIRQGVPDDMVNARVNGGGKLRNPLEKNKQDYRLHVYSLKIKFCGCMIVQRYTKSFHFFRNRETH